MIDALTTIRALSSQKRLDIVRALWHYTKPVKMQTIREYVGISRANMSQHVTKLVEAEIVNVTPRGRISTIMLKDNQIVMAIMEAIGE